MGRKEGALTREVGGEADELDKDGDEAGTARYSPESTAAAKWTKAPGGGIKTNADSVSRTGRRQFHQKYATPNKEQHDREEVE
jgi:hypothetical protein